MAHYDDYFILGKKYLKDLEDLYRNPHRYIEPDANFKDVKLVHDTNCKLPLRNGGIELNGEE